MIPKKIHYCWLGENPLPESAKKCIKSWKKHCPDYEIIEWNEMNYDFTKNRYMREAFEAKKWGFVPDYARLDIIYQHGGIYLDTDVELVRPYEDLLQYEGFAGFESAQYVALGLGFGAEAGNSIIKKLLDSYESLTFLNPDGSLNMIASPKLNTDVLVCEGLVLDGSMQVINGFGFLPPEYLCPKSFDDGIIRKTKNTYSIHHFDASWLDDKTQAKKIERWKRKQKKQARAKIRHFAVKLIGEKNYKWIRGAKQ